MELAKVLADIAADIAADVTADVAVDIAGGTELEVLLVAIHYWDSLKSYTSFSAQSLVVVNSYL